MTTPRLTMLFAGLRALIALTALSMAFGLAAPASAVTSADISSTERAEVRLHASVTALAPGDTATLALDQMLMPSWHSYWLNPGDAGLATAIRWTAPEGVEIGEIEWPSPSQFLFEGLMNYGYADRATLLMSVAAPADWPQGVPIDLEAKATWLVCADICVPEQATYRLSIPTGPETVANERLAAMFRGARAAVPSVEMTATYVATAGGIVLAFDAPELAQSGLSDVYFYADRWGVVDHAAPQTPEVADGALRLFLPAAEHADPVEGAVQGILTVVDETSGSSAPLPFQVTATPGAATGAEAGPAVGLTRSIGAADSAGPNEAAVVAAATSFSLLGAAAFAFLGGLILNLMPCVFPVLALKALSIANHAQDGARQRLTQGGAYAAGVLVSFLAFAAVLVGLKAAGAVVGWGFQLQTPIVVAVLAYVLFIVGLNLSGVFEVNGVWAGAGGSLAQRGGATGSFFTGVLAALVASPCTAPFMGAALGYALTQDAATTFVVFAALGLGFAAPIMALSAAPGVARVLPRPGAWMIRFRQALAFPMYAAAAWLLWVLGNQAGVDALFAALLGLVLLGLAGWAIGAGAPSSSSGRRVAAVAAVFALIGAVAALQPALEADDSGLARAEGGLSEPFDAARLDQLRADGRTIFVNMTADWCISCKVNERVVLHGETFEETLRTANAVYMKGDWTRRDPMISDVLAEFGRVGVPLYIAYRPGEAPQVLPQILTDGIVREALTKG